MKKIAIQGVKGAFHEEAARQFFNNDDIEIIEKMSFEEVLDSVCDYESDFGVIAIENTIAGTIHANLKLLRQKEVKIGGEIFIRIKQNLAAAQGVKIEELKEVYSHYMAINQTRQFFSKYPNIKLIESPDTALSMRRVAESGNKTWGAIGSINAAKINNLEVLAEGIETNKKNYTRFLIVYPKNEDGVQDYDKASLNVVLKNEPGGLAKILSVISFYNIDMSKIESSPIIGQPGNYMFYIDVKFDDKLRYKNMITAIRPLVKDLSIMGEYKAGEESWNNIHNQ
ncbi:MAG: prephenate dehydratase [Bacteroidales bacterium]|nr:prephenate dehydratase [Bacteroidales bacterium]